MFFLLLRQLCNFLFRDCVHVEDIVEVVLRNKSHIILPKNHCVITDLKYYKD